MDRTWLKTRKQLLRSTKDEVRRRLGRDPEDLKASHREVRKLAGQKYRISSKSEILSEIDSADIVYGGDFHAHGPAQRTHLKILRHLAVERPVVLALECFEARSQKWVDAYLKGKIDLKKLRERSKWDQAWGFPWDHYRPLIELAKKRNWLVAAIGVEKEVSFGAGGLKRQDHATARLLRSIMINRPAALVYVVIGELHLATLPTVVRAQFSRQRKLREVSLHLNAENVYFDLAKRNLEHSVDVVRYQLSSERSKTLLRRPLEAGVVRFGVISSPPWVPWQSYLLHLDQTIDLELDEGEDSDDFDPTDHIRRLIEWIAKDLGVKVEVLIEPLKDLAVYSPSDSTLWRKIETQLKGHEREMARRLLIKGRSFVLPSLQVGCLAQANVNNAAHLAGEYFQVILSKRRKSVWKFPRDFQGSIWVEALAYFASKLINHKRQAETIHDLRSELESIPATDEGRDALRLALDQRMAELVYFHQGRRRRRLVTPRKTAAYLEASLILGRMLGERLYGAFRARKILKREIVSLYKTDVLGLGFGRDYDVLTARVARAVGTEVAPSGLVPLKRRRERL